jgi:hypothetical protein
MANYCDNLKDDISAIRNNYSFTYFIPNEINVYDLSKCYSPSTSQNSPIIKMSDISNFQGNGSQQVYHTHQSCKINATILQSSYLKNQKNIIRQIENTNGGVKQGLPFKIVNGFYSNEPKFFLNSNIDYSDIAKDFTNLNSATNGKLNINKPATYSIEWYGFFKPSTTGIWNFTLSSDMSGVCFLWIGDIAINDYEIANSSIAGSNIFSLNLYANNYYPIRIQYGNQLYNTSNNFSLSITGPAKIDGIPFLCALYNNDGSLFEKKVLYYTLNEITPSLTSKGLFNCYVNDPSDNNNNKLLKKNVNGNILCNSTFTDICNNTIHYNPKNNSQYLYRIEGSPLINNTILINNPERKLKPILNNDMKLNVNSYISYNNYYPLNSDINNATNSSYNNCKTKCDDDVTCKYFYSYSSPNDASYCIIKNDSYFPSQLIPKQDNNIKFSTLNVRNKSPNLPTNDYRNTIPNKTSFNYNAYKDYETLDDKPLIISNPLDGLSKNMTNDYNNCNTYINGNIQGFKNIENFDNHGYTNSSIVLNSDNIKGNIIQQQLQPMIEISKDYNQLQGNISNKYYEINGTINNISNSNNTGIRDILSTNYEMYDFSGNYLNYTSKIPKKYDALNDDMNIMILEQNNLLILGTITIATLIIGAIYFTK